MVGESEMNFGIIGDQWWTAACEATGRSYVPLPPAVQPPAHPYSPDLGTRSEIGPRWQAALRDQPADALLDNGGAGLAFIPDPETPTSVKLLHEICDLPLASHLIDPLVVVFEALPTGIVWQALQSQKWHKFVWDRPQTIELQQFGVPNVHYLPMAAWDRPYNTDPVDVKNQNLVLSFVGGQNTSFFGPKRSAPTDRLLPAALALGVRSDLPNMSYFEAYFDLYGVAALPSKDADLPSRIQAVADYFNTKVFYNAHLCIKQRDRFVLFLKRKLGDVFTLIGDRWDTAYGLRCQPKLPTTEAYLDHFRTTAINLNFVNGNSESGLNMRHFEITAAGGFMMCYHTAEIDDFFEVDSECVTFHNEKELLEKVRYYLDHPQERVDIAHRGQQRTLREHLYSHRLETIRNALTATDAVDPKIVAADPVVVP